MTKTNRALIAAHTIVPHKRFGNEQAYSVTGGNLKRGQIVTVHAMCGNLTVVRKAIAQDQHEVEREQLQ